jgi:hypothetical protein
MGFQEFVEEPESHQVKRGSVQILRCVVRNHVGAVQWTRDGFALGSDRNLPGYPRYTMIGGQTKAGNLGKFFIYI